jgi:hypothetical protein
MLAQIFFRQRRRREKKHFSNLSLFSQKNKNELMKGRHDNRYNDTWNNDAHHDRKNVSKMIR